MSIDTEAKRCSALATRRLPWFRRFVPIPDGSVDQADEQQVSMVYRGILAAAPVVTTPPIIVSLTLDLTRAVSLSTPLSRSAALGISLTRAVNLTLDSE